MTGDNIESDAERVRNQGDTPPENTSEPEGVEGNSIGSEAPPAEPGGDSPVGEPDPMKDEHADTPEAEPADAPGGEPADAPEGESAAEGTEEQAPMDETSPVGADEEGVAVAAPVTAAGAVADEPAASELQEAGATGDDAAPAGEEEGELAAAAPVATTAAVDAITEEPPAVEGEEADQADGGESPAEVEGAAAAVGGAGLGAFLSSQTGKRRRLLVGLLVLAVLLIAAVVLFVCYLLNPEPLPDLLPLPVDVNYRPHYLFSVYGVEKPVGVAVSPDGERIYVTETSGGREVKVFDRDGTLLQAFSPPSTGPAERAPVYVAVDPSGRVFVTDRLQRAVFVYDREGNLLDTILGPDLTLSEYVSKHVDDLQPDSTLAYNLFGNSVLVQTEGQGGQVLPGPDPAAWAPLGVRLDERGTMLLTDVVEGRHSVREFPADLIMASSWREFEPEGLVFGAQGQGSGEFLYPNSAVADSQGRIYVTDGNNGRVSVWDLFGNSLFDFGQGVGESALSLPRGAAMDKRDRLHVVDAVDQSVKVYDVSEPEPRFLFAFGDWGTGEGEFNYPGDIALDGTGRLYVTDRENNRIQVWSY